jgi:hypothetical protein
MGLFVLFDTKNTKSTIQKLKITNNFNIWSEDAFPYPKMYHLSAVLKITATYFACFTESEVVTTP